MVRGRQLGLRDRKQQEGEENYTVRSFMICYTRQTLLGDVLMVKTTAAAFSTHGGEVRYRQCLGVTPEGKRKMGRT
jgi:acyl-CoA thioesterase FadM